MQQAHRIGAIAYIVWGLLHIMAARGLYMLAQTVDPGVVQARLVQGAWHLLFFAVAALYVAIRCNWHNSRLGYGLNLVLVSVTDVGFIVLVLAPGLAPMWPGILGPVLWLTGLLFTTIGYRQTMPPESTA